MITMDIRKILELLPHRYPFLLIDRVESCELGKSLVALKNVTINEPFFQGHFPEKPVMPGVLILEALAQATGLLAFYSLDHEEDGQIYYLVGVDKARFRRPVEPGDQLRLSIELRREIRGIYMLRGVATVEGEEVASADLMTSKADA